MVREDEDNDALEPIGSRALQRRGVFDSLFQRIRAEWQSRSLIERVRKLLPVDPSSACQRIFNAAIHDLREKVIIAGLDIAKEAARTFKLPPVEHQEDIEDYATSKLIDLSYRMGLLSRPEWRRLHRAYEIRRDLEHEDDEYEAQPEDCIYVFKTSIDAVLAKDPVHLMRVTDIKQIVEGTTSCAPSSELLLDYEHLPQPRQEEICLYLASNGLSDNQPEVVRRNSVEMLKYLEPRTTNAAKITAAKFLQGKIGRDGMDLAHAKVAEAIGATAYLKRVTIEDFFNRYMARMEQITCHWTQNLKHGKLLGDLQDVGGLRRCPEAILPKMLQWLVLAYIGEPGGYGAGLNRPVFYSNSAATLVRSLIEKPTATVSKTLKRVAESQEIQGAVTSKWIRRRLEELLDLAGE